jgi:hypothetical protein
MLGLQDALILAVPAGFREGSLWVSPIRLGDPQAWPEREMWVEAPPPHYCWWPMVVLLTMYGTPPLLLMAMVRSALVRKPPNVDPNDRGHIMGIVRLVTQNELHQRWEAGTFTARVTFMPAAVTNQAGALDLFLDVDGQTVKLAWQLWWWSSQADRQYPQWHRWAPCFAVWAVLWTGILPNGRPVQDQGRAVLNIYTTWSLADQDFWGRRIPAHRFLEVGAFILVWTEYHRRQRTLFSFATQPADRPPLPADRPTADEVAIGRRAWAAARRTLLPPVVVVQDDEPEAEMDPN